MIKLWQVSIVDKKEREICISALITFAALSFTFTSLHFSRDKELSVRQRPHSRLSDSSHFDRLGAVGSNTAVELFSQSVVNGNVVSGTMELQLAFDFPVSDKVTPNRVAVYYTDAPEDPAKADHFHLTPNGGNNFGKVPGTIDGPVERTVSWIHIVLDNNTVDCKITNINEAVGPGSKLTIHKSFTAITQLEPWKTKEFLLYTRDNEYAALGIGKYYFGARYYDPVVGVWMSTDAAGQFWNGYGYSGNPVVMVDPDGNLFFVPILIEMAWGAGIGAGIGGATYAISAGSHGDFSWSGLSKQMFFGAIGGAVTGGFGSTGTSLATNMFYSALGNGLSYGMTTTIAGNQMTAGGFGAALLGGALGGLVPTYAGLNNYSSGKLAENTTTSIFGEIIYGAGKGALMGGLSASIETGDIQNFGEGAKMGAFSGVVGAATLIGWSGKLYSFCSEYP